MPAAVATFCAGPRACFVVPFLAGCAERPFVPLTAVKCRFVAASARRLWVALVDVGGRAARAPETPAKGQGFQCSSNVRARRSFERTTLARDALTARVVKKTSHANIAARASLAGPLPVVRGALRTTRSGRLLAARGIE